MPTREQLQLRFPNASESFLRANASDHVPAPDHSTPSAPVVECDLRNGPLAAGKAEGRDSGKFLVRVTSFRRRLLDEDNLCAKYVVDCCRYAGLIPGDAPGQARIVTTQEKVRSKEDERTEILIERLE